MIWFLYVEFILLSVDVVAQIVAIGLLYRDRNKRRNKYQMHIISSLCLTELNGTLTGNMSIAYRKVSPFIEHTVWFYLHSFVSFTYHSTMTLLK